MRLVRQATLPPADTIVHGIQRTAPAILVKPGYLRTSRLPPFQWPNGNLHIGVSTDLTTFGVDQWLQNLATSGSPDARLRM